jgi:hypothetical protein
VLEQVIDGRKLAQEIRGLIGHEMQTLAHATGKFNLAGAEPEFTAKGTWIRKLGNIRMGKFTQRTQSTQKIPG